MNLKNTRIPAIRATVDRRIVVAVSLFVAALALRAVQIGALPTTDEAITVRFVQQYTAWELLYTIPVRQPNFPLYYLVLDVWSHVAPIRSARVLSVVAGSLTPVVTYLFARELLSERRAVLAGGLVVGSPVLVNQSHWLRMYAFVPLFVVLSWHAAWRWWHGDGRGWVYGVLAVVSIGLHPFAVAAVLAQVSWLAIEQYYGGWRRYFRLVAGGLGVLMVGAALVLLGRVVGLGLTVGPVDGMHIHYATRPVLKAVVLPVTTLTGTLHHTPFVLLGALVAVIGVANAASNRVWECSEGRLLVWWVAGSLGVLYLAHAVFPVVMLKYVGFLAPGVAILLAASTPFTFRGYVVYGSLFGMQSVLLALGYLIQLKISQVAVWGIGVVDVGAI